MAANPSPQQATYNGIDYDVVQEGLAEILTPAGTETIKTSTKPQDVFYNPVQQYNRDLSVLAIKAFGEDFTQTKDAKREKWGQSRRGKVGKKRKRDVHDVDGTEDVNFTLTRENGVDDTAEEPADAGERGPNRQDLDGTNELAKGPSNRPRPPLRILDALSASGLRALRYAKELPFPTQITANDLSPLATKAIALNVEHNRLEDQVHVLKGDANEHMRDAASTAPGLESKHSPGLYHVIDLDPYGTSTPYLDAAVRALVDGGLLCVTCTDAGVFASTGYLEKTYSQYGGLPLKGPHAHEGGLRLILNCIATAAGRYGIAIEPLLSLSIDFYVRVFVRLHKSPAEVKFLASKTMLIYGCDGGCGAWSIQHLAQAKGRENKNGETIYKHTSALGPTANPLCEHCGFKTHVAGPMWGGPIHNLHFIQRILDTLPLLEAKTYGTIARIEGMLNLAMDEDLDASWNLGNSDSNPPNELSFGQDADNPPEKSHGESKTRLVPQVDPAARAHHRFFFVPASLARIIHCETPSDPAIRGALLHLGYRTSRSHTKPGSIVTDAPWAVIWEIMREWARQKNGIKAGVIKNGTAGRGIMLHDRSKTLMRDARQTFSEALGCGDEKEMWEKLQALVFRMEEQLGKTAPDESTIDASIEQQNGHEPSKKRGSVDVSKLKVVFDEDLGRAAQGSKRMVRYQQNPQPDWGPMSKAKANGS